jgi:hypothetical protein
MIVCPNKSLKAWKELSNKIGEDRAMLAFIRNNNEIPDTEAKARDLITNIGLLNSLENIPVLSEEKIQNSLLNQGLTFDSFQIINGKKYYALNPDVKDLGKKLGEISSDFGAILEYLGEYVTVSKEGLKSWNDIATLQNRNNKTPTELAKSFLTRIGVKISEQDDIIKQYGSNGVADFAEKMVLIQTGKMEEALTEEALHFFLDMIPQDMPELIEALDKIRNTNIYKSTLEQYKNNPNYRTKTGEIRFDKIKKEALAKQINQNLKAEPTTVFGKIIKKIIDWIKSIRVQKSPYDILTDMFRSEDISRLNMNMTSDEVYNQLEDEQKKFYEKQNMNASQKETLNKLLALNSNIDFVKNTHTLTHTDPITNEASTLNSVTSLLGSEFDDKLKYDNVVAEIVLNLQTNFSDVIDSYDSDEVKAAKLVSHVIDKIINGELKKDKLATMIDLKITELIFKAVENRKKTLFGTAVHSIVEAIIYDKKIDFDETDEKKRIVDPIIFNFMDKATLTELLYGTARKPGIINIISDLIKSGHVLITELEVGNNRIGGIIDIIAIDKNGVAHVYDFKTKYLRDDVNFRKFATLEDEFDYVTSLSSGSVKSEEGVLPEVQSKPRSLKEKYSQQLSIYKKLLMEKGIMVGDITIIAVAYKLNDEGKVKSIKPFLTNPLGFNDRIAVGYFPNIDMNNDANKKKEIKTEEDENVKLLDKISKPKMKEAFAKMKGRLDQIYAYFKKNKDARVIYDILSDEDGSNRVEDMQRLVKNFLENYGPNDDMTNMLALQKGFIDIIDSSGPIIKLISDEFEKLKNTTSPNQEAAVQKIKELTKIRDFIVGYQNMFKEMLSYLDTTDVENPLVLKLNEMVGAIVNIRNNYVDYITPTIVSALGGEFTKELLDNMIREYNELIVAAEERGDKNRSKKLKEERDSLPSEKVIAELLKGERGDANEFWSKFLATISNPDIILSGVAKRLKRVLDTVRLKMKTFRDSLSVEFDKRQKVYGKGVKLSSKEANQSLMYEAKQFNGDKPDSYILMFKSEFHEDLYYDYQKLKFELDKAYKSEDKDAITIAKKKVKDFEIEYFQSNYTAEYYRLTSMLDRIVNYGDRKTSIREIVGTIFEDIAAIESLYTKDILIEGNLRPEHLLERQSLWERYYNLMELKNPDGTDKTGDDLVIAKSLNEYQENKNSIYNEIELTNLFEKTRTKVLFKHGENSDEYKKWMSDNTRIKILDKYYEEMDALMAELATLSTNKNSEEISELYKELRTITQPFKDKDGYINGMFMKPETVERIKKIESEISELRDGVEEYTVDGYTYEEKKAIKQQQWNREYDKDNYDKYVKINIDADRDERLENNKDLKEKVARAKEIRSLLFNMRVTEYTKYYYEELENQERLFAKEKEVSYEEFKINNTLYGEFRDSTWFKANHNYKVKILQDEDFGDSVKAVSYEPIYIWKRNTPIKDYIIQKPARHFYRRELKEEYTNSKGEVIRLINKDNRDILNRYKPKTNEQYKKEYNKDHKYLNKEYVSLKQKYENKSANDKEKVDYENLIYFHKTMLEYQENIEPRYRIGFAAPFEEKSISDRIVETKGANIKSGVLSVVDGMRRKLQKTEASGDEGFLEKPSNDLSKLATVDNDEVRYVPVRHASRGAASDNSYDVFGSVLGYVGSIIRKKELDGELALINGLEEILGEKENQPKSEYKNSILNNNYKLYLPEMTQKVNLGKNTRLEVFKSFINSVLYNEDHFEGNDVLGINTQKAIDQVMKLSSLTFLGLAPFNWTVNWLSGQVQNMIEAAGGKFYDFKSYMDAKKEIYASTKYGYVMKDMMNDFSKVGYKSFWGQVMEVFDPIQGETENEFGQKTSWNKYTNILKAGIFSGKIFGEWEIQMSSFIAFMKNVKYYNGKMYDKDSFITMKIGTDFTGSTTKEIRDKRLEAINEFNKLTVNLLDILERKNGVLSVKDQYSTAFELGGKQFSDLVAKLHAMQKRINGSYAKFDQAYAAKSSIGRLMFFFRKYFIQLAVNRFSLRRNDYEGMTVEQGFYITFTQTILRDLVTFRFKSMLLWDSYSDSERAGIRKTITELMTIATCMAIYTLLLGYDPDDKERMKKLKKGSWAQQAAIFTLLKVRSETEQFLPLAGLDEIVKIYSNPSILLGTFSNFITMFNQILLHLHELTGYEHPDLYYKKDSGESMFKEKGDSKLMANFMRTFVGYTGKTFHPIDAIKGFEYGEDMLLRK